MSTTPYDDLTIESIDCRGQNGGWRWVTFTNGTRTHMTVAEVQAIDPSAETALLLATDEQLVNSLMHFTHLKHAARDRKDYAAMAEYRGYRDQVQAEVLRRMAR